jgi:Flp pilus assembly protein TadB
MKTGKENLDKLREIISKEKGIIKEMISLENYIKRADKGEEAMVFSQFKLVKQSLRKTNEEIPLILEGIHLTKDTDKNDMDDNLPKINEANIPKIKDVAQVKHGEIPQAKPSSVNLGFQAVEKRYSLKELKPTELERLTLKRIKNKYQKVEIKKEKKPSLYIKFANLWFSKLSEKILDEKTFQDLERDLIKANLQFTPRSYISVIFLTTCIVFLASILVSSFFLFFKIGVTLPIITKATETLATMWWKLLIVIILSPLITFLIMYSYPGLERGSTESRLEEELPFATIHMSAISGSMIDPSKIFDIIISTHEYPYIEKEFKKLINEINLYGYDLVNALRNSAYNSPSRKLSELFNGLATTINSGGYLPEFFDKRSQTLLFENRLEQEKKTKAAETFMDIYISLVIAAPMILMILLMMMKISGLGVSMSTKMITTIMVLTVTMINIVFLTFLQLKR